MALSITVSSTKIPQPSPNSRDHSSPNHVSLSQPSPNSHEHSSLNHASLDQISPFHARLPSLYPTSHQINFFIF
ncbi:unnamed protein product [Brassica oleracea]|uniref:(rape) hypothetical protein n=1 Tax=Brassica napus TaxID=3708 RepID=A0A816Q2G6_BRANA|nr:unnamed protein product [Brassica napus]